MEDALKDSLDMQSALALCCLNPCFNGRRTRSKVLQIKTQKSTRLNPCFNGRRTRSDATLLALTKSLWS